MNLYGFVQNDGGNEIDLLGEEEQYQMCYITTGKLLFYWSVLPKNKCKLETKLTFEKDWFAYLGSFLAGAKTKIKLITMSKTKIDCSEKCSDNQKGIQWVAHYKVKWKTTINIPSSIVTLASAGTGKIALTAGSGLGKMLLNMLKDSTTGYVAGKIPLDIKTNEQEVDFHADSNCCCYCK